MAHTTTVAAGTAATTASSSTQRPRRHRTSGSFHAGEPFPQLSPYDEAIPSSSRRRRNSPANARLPFPRQPTAKYHTFPTSPPATPSELEASPQQSHPWYKRLFQSQEEEATGVSGIRDAGSDTNAVPRQPPYSSGDDDGRELGGKRVITNDDGDTASTSTTPLPWKQLGLLAFLSLAEQTALNSIGPYLPAMVTSFEEIPDGQEGLYVGLLASAFALAQLTTNLLWGYLSDRVGRKPTMLLGTSLLAACFMFFGFCATYAQLIMVHVAMGLLNGNAAIVPTCLGEVTDRTNQSRAFTWLPVIYSLGSITGPALGGLLVGVMGGPSHPFLAPNIIDAALLLASVIVLAIWFEETLDNSDPDAGGAGLDWIRGVRDWCAALGRMKQKRTSGGKRRQRVGWMRSDRDTVLDHDNQRPDTSDDDERQGLLSSNTKADRDDDNNNRMCADDQKSAFRQVANRNTLAVLGTYLVFQLANISFNSLYPIFVSSAPPTGRGLGPGAIGLSLSFAGLATILFQIFLFQRFKARMGNLRTYRYSLLGIAASMALMPWIGYPDQKSRPGFGTGEAWLYAELGVTLVAKNICAVGGLSSVMLLITNSAPSNETLGTLNGIAQTLSAAGRSVGPFLSGGLFTLSTRVRPKGEALAWGIFAGITISGWVGSLAIRGNGLESAEWTDCERSNAGESSDDNGDPER
ncbi:Tetracycline resistance (Probable transport) [Madurella fahalii]|uniref:Tetracycline resistance (Probable transport) n=1 Tax=Madurella fahalii TaxID=1157608 RepID=A0ABQ0G472_9PEZI